MPQGRREKRKRREYNKYLGKINWIFAQCGRLYLWVAVRCAREAPLLAPAPYFDLYLWVAVRCERTLL